MNTIIIAGAVLLLIVVIAYRNGKATTKEKQKSEVLDSVAKSKKNRELVHSKSAINKLRSIAKNRDK